MSQATESPRFQTTHWSLVARAARGDSGEGRAALSELCQIYWFPVYVFLRRRGLAPADAEDMTQEFFAELLTRRRLLETADPAEGRFRTYLLAAVKHLLANQRRHAAAECRGGQAATLQIDWTNAEQRYAAEPADGWTAEAIFHRRWALIVLERVLDQLADHYQRHDRGAWFDSLRTYLTTDEKPPYRELAERLGTTDSAIRVAVHRLRQHYRDGLIAEIRATIGEGDNANDERAELLRALLGPQARA